MKTWPDFLLEALLAAHDPPAARDLFARYARRSRRLIATRSPPRPRCRTSPPSSRCRRTRRSASTSSARRAATALPASSCGATAGRCRCPSGCRCSSTWASPSSTRAPTMPSRRGATPSSSGSTTCCSRSPATARSISTRCAESSTTASPPSCAPTRRTTATTRSCCAPASPGARWRWCARCRAICGRSACPIPRTTCGRRWCAMPTSRRSSWRCSRRGSIPISRSTRRSARSARPTAVAAIEEGLTAVESLDEDRILRHFVNAVTAALRTNYFQPSAARRHQADRHQVRQPQGRGHAVAAAALRDFSVLAAARSGASAVRAGGARRHPLVGPAAGLPHRDPGPRQGAAGQERGHRSRRRQGRLRAEAAAHRQPRRHPERGRRHLPAVHVDHARHHRQSRPRPRDPADRRGAARRRRSLSRGRRRQGHRDLLRYRQRDLARPPLLARRCLRVRRLDRLRPQEDGDYRTGRLGVGPAPLPRDECRHRGKSVHRGRRRRHVGRRVRQRHAARAHHQARRRLRSPRHLHRSRSRSGAELQGARAPVQPAALELAGLRPLPDLAGRRRLFALREGDRAQSAGAGACSASPRHIRRPRRS